MDPYVSFKKAKGFVGFLCIFYIFLIIFPNLLDIESAESSAGSKLVKQTGWFIGNISGGSRGGSGWSDLLPQDTAGYHRMLQDT